MARIPLQITKNLDLMPEIEDYIRRRAEKLDRLASDIMRCRVSLSVINAHQQSKLLYSARIDLTLTGREIAVSHEASTDLRRAIRMSFESAEKQLKQKTDRRAGIVKHHDSQPMGHISEIHGDEGFGFIRTLDGRDIYFHRNSIINGRFDDLEPGLEVMFVEEDGEKGPQASTVRLASPLKEAVGFDRH